MEKDLVEAKIAYNEWLRRGGDGDEAWKEIYRLTKKKIPNTCVDRWRWYLHNNYGYFHPEYGKVLWFDSKSRAILMAQRLYSKQKEREFCLDQEKRSLWRALRI
jgi:hypothetical protein